MHEYTKQINWIEGQHNNMVDLLLAWSRINSGSFNIEGIRQMRAALAKEFAALGGEAEIIPMPPLQQVTASGDIETIEIAEALRIRKHSNAPIKIVLCGHMDTVFPADSTFQTPRWINDNVINGPGVADLKGGLVCMLFALKALEQSKYASKIGWEVLLNPDEEIGSQSSNELLVEAARENDFGLIYEPALADGTLAGARKGSGNFTYVIKGISAHAGREFTKGRNAIVLAAELAIKLYSLNNKRPDVTINPAKIEGGSPNNIVPDIAILRFNVRMPKMEDQQWLEQQFTKIETELNKRQGFTITRHGGFTRPPKQLSPQNIKLFELAKECATDIGINITWQDTGGCCDGNNMAAAGLPNIDSLGVRGGNIHSHEEFVFVDSLTERAKLSALLLFRLAEGAISIKSPNGIL